MRCCPRPDRWKTRAQPWLGTLVEVSLPRDEAGDAFFAAAFAAVAHVHRTMSAHDPASDLAHIARDAHRRPVVVDAQTFAVLELALMLHRESGGAFDVGIAPMLARSGALPESAGGHRARGEGMGALRLEAGHTVRATGPAALDLGGIAKGYAVDRAVDALRASGARAGLVNAGGDLRVFGADTWVPVRIRHPAAPPLTLQFFDIRDAAVATSADYFRGATGGLVNPRDRRMRRFPGSVTVVAPTCALADALTKIVALRPAESAALLARHGAAAFKIDDSGTTIATTCSASTPNLRLAMAAAA